MNTVNIGDIFVSVNGQGFDSVSFYKITSCTKKSCTLVKIGKIKSSDGSPCFSIASPDTSVVQGKPMRRKLYTCNSLVFHTNEDTFACVWNGVPIHCVDAI